SGPPLVHTWDRAASARRCCTPAEGRNLRRIPSRRRSFARPGTNGCGTVAAALRDGDGRPVRNAGSGYTLAAFIPARQPSSLHDRLVRAQVTGRHGRARSHTEVLSTP